MKDDTQKSIGTLLGSDVTHRDAIHIAVVPVIAADGLMGGDHVDLAYGTTNQVKRAADGEGIGVIDPFLKTYLRKGDRCWLFLHPNTVTGMRHEWVHPVFDAPLPMPKSEAEAWLRKFADRWNFDYDEMIATAQEKEGGVVANGIDLHSASELDAGDEAMFWQNIEAITQQKFDDEHRNNFTWSCSC